MDSSPLEWTISAEYREIGSDKEGIITNVYGPQLQQDKQNFLQSLRGLRTLQEDIVGFLGGDFNMITSLEEKKGVSRLEHDYEEFKETIEDLGLIDIENINGEFTWSNRRSGSQHIACRLDHFLVS
jgi:hypothetical protein